MKQPLTLLCVGAHPDDCEINCGGLAALCAERGDEVVLLSVTDGSAGHQSLGRIELAARRAEEARSAAQKIGATSIIMGAIDGELEPSMSNRLRLIQTIRQIAPDLIVTNRSCDYHPDHRYTAQLVNDSCYLLRVPNIAESTPPLSRDPVVMYWYDRFETPNPFVPDIVIDVDPVFSVKRAMIGCHHSQVFEWLPWVDNQGNAAAVSPAERDGWLDAFCERLNRTPLTGPYRELMVQRYDARRGESVRHAEAFRLSEYGHQPSNDELVTLFDGM